MLLTDPTMRIREILKVGTNWWLIPHTQQDINSLSGKKRIIFCQIIVFSSCGLCHGWKGAVTLQVNKALYREWKGNSPSEQTTTKSYPRLVFQKKGSASCKSSILLCLKCSVLILLAWEASLLRKQASYLALPVCFPCTVHSVKYYFYAVFFHVQYRS